jgi:superfamily II DNA or RNA helicase
MLIQQTPVDCKVLSWDDEDEQEWLSKYLTLATKKYNGRDHYLHKEKLFTRWNTFPAGLLPMVYKAAIRDEHIVRVVKDSYPDLRVENPDVSWLKPIQKDALESALDRKRGIVWASTAFGKTEVAIGLVRSLDAPAVFLVSKKSLLYQTKERFENRNSQHGIDMGEIGIVGDGKGTIGDRLTIATFATLNLRQKNDYIQRLFKETRLIIVDECHTCATPVSLRVLSNFRDAPYRIGFSGTPLERGDQKSLLSIGALGVPIFKKTASDMLSETDLLAKPNIHFVSVPQIVERPNWQGVYQHGVVKSDIRNSALVDIAKFAPKPSLLFIKDISHGNRLLNMIQRAGINSEFVSGKHDESLRVRRIEQLERGDIDVLVCSVIFDTGVDIPELRSVIVGSAGKSAIANLQRLGRGMRLADGKKEFDLYDVYDRGNGMLERQAKERMKTLEKAGHKIKHVSLDNIRKSLGL